MGFFHDSAVAADEEPNMAIVFGYVPCGSQGCRIEEAMDDIVSYSMNLNESLFKEMAESEKMSRWQRNFSIVELWTKDVIALINKKVQITKLYNSMMAWYIFIV